MKALDFIQIFASNVRRLDFRLSSAQVILAVIAGYRRHSTITEATRLHPNTVTNILQDLIAQGYVNRIGDGRPYVYRPTADGEQLAGNLLDKKYIPRHMKKSPAQYGRKTPLVGPRFPGRGREYSQADKFKALVEDTKLAALQQEEEEFKRQREMGAAPQDPILALLQSLPPAELNLNNHPSS